ncbi:hypothetical protein QQM39_29210 [Streptomyces sp. DT2A-34]|nr:hypothetical protein [Streptomyces sp. DT2A-34]MDO0914761.1 hypothetical protein [Streptomyces sp. DT2A-34]
MSRTGGCRSALAGVDGGRWVAGLDTLRIPPTAAVRQRSGGEAESACAR